MPISDWWNSSNGQIHEHAPDTEFTGNSIWRLDSDGETIWIAESCGEFSWVHDHKVRIISLDSGNPTLGWNYRIGDSTESGDSTEFTPMVLGEKYELPESEKRTFTPDSSGVGYLFFKSVVKPFPEPATDRIFGFKVQE